MGKHSREHYVEFNHKPPGLSSLDFWPAAELCFLFFVFFNLIYVAQVKLWISKIYELARIILDLQKPCEDSTDPSPHTSSYTAMVHLSWLRTQPLYIIMN